MENPIKMDDLGVKPTIFRKHLRCNIPTRSDRSMGSFYDTNPNKRLMQHIMFAKSLKITIKFRAFKFDSPKNGFHLYNDQWKSRFQEQVKKYQLSGGVQKKMLQCFNGTPLGVIFKEGNLIEENLVGHFLKKKKLRMDTRIPQKHGILKKLPVS